SGIEPIFSLAFVRQILDGKTLLEFNQVFVDKLRRHFTDQPAINRICNHALERGTIRDCDGIPEELKHVFRTARDVAPEWHVRMQAAWQRHIDSAVSKTINFPSAATIDEVKAAYLLAYKLGCKGITVYRDGSRRSQPMALHHGTERASDMLPA